MNGKPPLEPEDLSGAFSAAEREALAAWRPQAPPAGFADGVLRAYRTEGQSRGAVAPPMLRNLAVAAAALVLLGGFLSLRGWSGTGYPEGSAPVPGFNASDGGPGPEVPPEVGLEVGLDDSLDDTGGKRKKPG